MQRRSSALAGAKTMAGVASIALVATGCYLPWDRDNDHRADVAWVSVVDTGDPATTHVVLTRQGTTDPEIVGADGSTTWLAGHLDVNKQFSLATEHADGTWRSGTTTVAFAPSGPGATSRFLGSFAADPGMEVAYYFEGSGTWEVQDVGTVVLGVPDDGAALPDHDVPVPADYDGDGLDEPAVYRPTDHTWWRAGDVVSMPVADLGIGMPAPADYDGDGADDPAVYDLVTGEVRIEGMAVAPVLPVGGLPAPADYDGDGVEDPAVVTTDDVTGERVLTIAGQGEHRQPGTADGGPTPWTARTAIAHRRADLLALVTTPLPLAGRGNHLGTGRLGYGTAGTAYEPENLSLSINADCTSKAQGDLTAARYLTTENCTGTSNPDHRAPAHEYVISLPEGRSYDTDVLLYDAGYITLTGCIASSDSCRHDGDSTLEADELAPSARFPDDFNPGGGAMGAMTTTFRLYGPSPGAPLAAPLDADPTACAPATRTYGGTLGPAGSTIEPQPNGTRTFAPNTKAGMTNTYYPPTGSGAALLRVPAGWWNLCRIPASAPAGDYTLAVDHGSLRRNGSNNYAVVADRVDQSGLCLAADDPTCPLVSARRWASVRAAASVSTARFPIVSLDSTAAGRTLRVSLWDPAEGAQALRLLRPTNDGGVTYVPFSWADSAGNGQHDVTSLNVSSYNFNAKTVTIEATVPADYDPSTSDDRWILEYQTSQGTVTDRTTWWADLAAAPALVP